MPYVVPSHAHVGLFAAPRVCPAGQFQCPDHNCTRAFQLCDGVKDCSDGADELNCDEPCGQYHFKCNSTGRCIPERFVCDGDQDCNDGSDENATLCRECPARAHTLTHTRYRLCPRVHRRAVCMQKWQVYREEVDVRL
jgi:hypothetical protein